MEICFLMYKNIFMKTYSLSKSLKGLKYQIDLKRCHWAEIFFVAAKLTNMDWSVAQL